MIRNKTSIVAFKIFFTLFLLAFIATVTQAQNDYKVRLLKPDGRGGLIVQKSASSRSSAESAALADADAAGDDDAVDIEKFDAGEAAKRGQATESTLSSAKTSLDSLSAKMPAAGSLADGTTTPSTTIVGAAELNYNGATFDLKRNNQNITILASGARTATPTLSDQTNYNARGLIVVINVTAVTGSPSVVFSIEGKDGASGTYYSLLDSAAVTGTGQTVLRVYPGLTAVSNVTASDILPRTWHIKAVHTGSDSITYSIGVSLIN